METCVYCGIPLEPGTTEDHCTALDCTLQCPECRGEAAEDAAGDRYYEAERDRRYD